MENEIVYFNGCTVIKNQNVFHRENDYEWKYVGVWGDLLEEDFKMAMKKAFSSENITELFVAKGEYGSVMAMLQENLRKRNEYNQEEANKKK